MTTYTGYQSYGLMMAPISPTIIYIYFFPQYINIRFLILFTFFSFFCLFFILHMNEVVLKFFQLILPQYFFPKNLNAVSMLPFLKNVYLLYFSLESSLIIPSRFFRIYSLFGLIYPGFISYPSNNLVTVFPYPLG